MGDGRIKKVLITGASGFIGRSLAELLNTDYEIISLVRKPSGYNNEVVANFCENNFPTVVNRLPRVGTVVHLGARVGWYENSRQNLFTPNVLATAVLANWAKKINAYFCFASAAMVCGVRNPNINCESKVKPDTDYGYSKWLGEEIIKMSGVRHVLLRIGGVYGRNGPFHLGINRAINDALNGKPPIQYGDGQAKRNYIYVKDVGIVIKHCIDNKIEGTHLVAGSAINTFTEMLEIICKNLLPNKRLKHINGKSINDQIIEHSSSLPKGCLFEDAIKNIKESK